MTRVLVAYATKMGGTEGIARAIADRLGASGLAVDLREAGSVGALADYDAAVVGSALYTGRWRPHAVRLLKRLAGAADSEHPIRTWLFHSGPCGPDGRDKAMAPPSRVAALAQEIGAAAPTTFGGRIESASAKGFIARKMAVGPNAGDFRDFDRIRQWADGIADTLSGSTSAVRS